MRDKKLFDKRLAIVHSEYMEYFNRLFRGRINRRNYFIGGLLLAIISVAANTLYKLLFSNLHVQGLSIISIGIFTVITFLIILLNVSLNIQRLHDLGNSGFVLLLVLVPLVNILLILLLLFKSGEGKSNKYGGVPPQVVYFPADILGLQPSTKTGFVLSRNTEKMLFIFVGILF